MATYVNNLRLKEITTGDENGTWGVSTNTNLELVTDGFSYGTKAMAADANETFTMPDATADATRGFYLKITSAGTLTATREVTLGPNTVSKVWLIENATTGSQIITIKQGSGATINVASGSKVLLVTDGAGAGAAVINANPTEVGAGTVTSVDVSGGTTGLTTSGGPVTGSGTITVAGTLAVANGGTGITALGTGVAAAIAVNVGSAGAFTTFNGDLGTPSALVLTNATGTVTNLTLVTPALGTPSALVLTNATGTLTSPTFVTPALGTPASGTLSSCTVDGTDEVGFRNIPQNSQSAAYTLVLADAGKHIFHPVADNTARTFTIPANASVAYPVGTAITFINMAVADVTIAITTDTLTLSDDGSTGSRTLAQYGSSTCVKITSTEWLISGSNLT
jgi:hypothetical protein